MSALRVARAATGPPARPQVRGRLSRTCRRHAGARRLGRGGVRDAGLAQASMLPSAAGTLVLPFNDADAVVAAFRARRRRIAAVIVEPVAANMGVIPPQPGFLEALRDVTRSDGALLIFDEVITGLPRRARRRPGALRHRPGPDAPGQGHRGRDAHRRLRWTGRPHGHAGPVWSRLPGGHARGPPGRHGSGRGHAGCRHDRRSMAASSACAQRLEVGLRAAAERRAVPQVSISRVGSLLTVFFRAQAPRDLEEAEATDAAAFGRFHAALWDRGVFVPPSRFEAWFVSAALRRQDVDTVVLAAHEALAAAA